jgi:aminoglycoside phosphotransferase family enzyme/ribosome-associated translation inhibitor RaiA
LSAAVAPAGGAEFPYADLLRPEAYPHRPGAIELIETHVSWVFLAGERVYKVKKPVDLGFLDFTAQERRRYFCEEELRLNARLAPGIYLGIETIGRDAEGRLAVGAPGAPAEPCVEMRRLPADGMLDRRAERGAIGERETLALAELLARFHREARRDDEVAVHGTAERVRFLCEENFAALLPWAVEPAIGDPLVPREELARLRAHTHAFLDEHDAVFRRRVREGRIVEGHGDLHAGNLCFVDGRPIAFDALEFAPRFRCADAACDLAFLTMDLRRKACAELAERLAARYAELSGDDEVALLLPFYEAYRALVRAKIAALRAGLPPQDHAAAAEARAYLALARERLPRPSASIPAPESPESLSTHREEAHAMNLLFHFENYSLHDAEREKLRQELEALAHVTEQFPVKDLHVHIHRHPHHHDFHVKFDLHLPGGVLFTGERGENYHPAFTACAKQMIAKVKAFKDQLGHRHEWKDARHENLGG